MRFAAVLFFFCIATVASSQSLEFLGMPSVSFGMKLQELKDPQLMLDTSSSYTDTAVYLKMTRCHMYYSKTQNLQLKGFSASRIEYQFCDSLLSYVFVYVNGKENISSALDTLKHTFPKMGCGKNVPLGTCTYIDTSNRSLRMIVRIDYTTNEMKLVIIPKKAAG